MRLIDCFNVKINNGFWKEKINMVKSETINTVYERFRETHRFEALSCKWKEGEPNMPHVFWDSDVAKWIEGVAYILAHERNEILEGIIDCAVEEIVSNSDENGYFNSHFLVNQPQNKFTDRDCHELYCAGHLIEAAVAYYKATGKTAFLKQMCKYADYIERIFKYEDSAAFTTPGHPELELALMRLYEVTGEMRYAELSKFFIDKHGNNKKDKEVCDWATKSYNLDEKPLREISEPAGHAVRALYLLCGMADVAKEFEDVALYEACEKCFNSIVNKRMYITGGIGSTHLGEAFTVDYHLPNRTAYAETCAAISLAMFCLRMQKSNNSSKYADTIERAMYNGVLSGISMSGKEFFYENPLEIDLDFNNVNPATVDKERFPITERLELFYCSCCPPNLIRFISSIGGYIYGYDEDTVYVNQFIDSSIQTDGVDICIRTEYPVNGTVNIRYKIEKRYLAVRIPGWCDKYFASKKYFVKEGYMIFDAEDGDEITVEFDMPVITIQSNAKVHENAGKIAITRGPIVYCAESKDNGLDLNTVYLNIHEEYKIDKCEFLLPNIMTTAYVSETNELLYYKADAPTKKVDFTLIPYYAFANRGADNMKVWFMKL